MDWRRAGRAPQRQANSYRLAPPGSSLGVLFVAYSYSAFSAGRQPKSVAVISGTGMVIPAAL